jgi:DNA-binding GntR family transcriptional regulator
MADMSNEEMQPYQRIFADIRDKIRDGALAAHDKLPSTRELAEQYGVAHGTVQRALSELRLAGLIYSHQGRGSYISEAANLTDSDTLARLQALEEKVETLTARLSELEHGHSD